MPHFITTHSINNPNYIKMQQNKNQQLDAKFRKFIKVLIMIFITHNIDQALLLSDRILIMRSPTELLEIKPAKEYCSLSPDERIDTSEYKKLFFEIVENLKYEK